MKNKNKIRLLKKKVFFLDTELKRYKTENESLKYRLFEKEITELFEKEYVIEDGVVKTKEACKTNEVISEFQVLGNKLRRTDT